MNKGPTKMSRLTPCAEVIADLVETVGGGSQREFARLVGCAQPVISRIVTGQQQPGKKLLERIAKVDGVDRKALMATRRPSLEMVEAAKSMVPIARCLLDGLPAERRERLTDRAVGVSPLVYRPTLYAVSAEACEPAFSDEVERMHKNDLLLVDADKDRLRKNIGELSGRLCAVSCRVAGVSRTLLLRVCVWAGPGGKDWQVSIAPDLPRFRGSRCPFKLVPPLRERDFHFVLPGPERYRWVPESERPRPELPESIRIDDIDGAAIQMIRDL